MAQSTTTDETAPAFAESLPSLSSAQVAQLTAEGRTNRASTRSSRSVASILAENIFTPFNALLGALCVIMLVFGSPKDALFGIALVLNTAIGLVQELRAKALLDKITLLTAPGARVIRDGAVARVDQTAVVLGDTVLLGPGDQLVADGPLLASESLEVDESLLTGESRPVVKAAGDAVRSGSFVVAGAGAFRADAVGDAAYAAKIAAEGRKFSRTRSDLADGIGLILKVIGVIIVPVGALTLWAQLRTAPDLTVAVTNTVAALVGMVPEGLVLLVSVAFAVAAVRLARQGVLTQELPAVEVLARVDVLCADKTGTLTEPQPAFDRVEALGGDEAEVTAALGALAGLSPARNATADAISAAIEVPAGWSVSGSVPFSSATKWSAASFTGRGTWVLGAPAVLMEPGVSRGDPGRIAQRAGAIAATGSRVLLLASTDAALEGERGLPSGLVPRALVVLSERIRPDAADTVRYFTAQDVTVKVISGDDPATVSAVATAAAVPDAGAAIDARELPAGDGPDAVPALGEAMARYAVFGRVVSEQKRGFVRALQQQGRTVAMTGDGVNDVLALKQADLGIAMGSGAAATRSVAQLVMLDGRFAALPGVVAEGRRVTANAERVANLFLTKTVWATVLALTTAMAAVPFPFLPRHLTLVGSLTIGIPAFFLALAPNPRRYVPGFVGRVIRFAIPSGVIVSLAVFASAWAANRLGADAMQTRTVATIALTLCGLAVIEVIERPLTGWRLGIVVGMLVLLAGCVAIPFVRDFFALAVPPFDATLAGVGVAVSAWGLLSLVGRFAGPGKESA